VFLGYVAVLFRTNQSGTNETEREMDLMSGMELEAASADYRSAN
jgi:hypothetical protein